MKPWNVSWFPGNAYNQEERVVCAGYDNGDIKLFDLRNMSLRWETNIKNGVCSLEFDRKDISMNKLVATSLEGKFHVFDMRTQHPTKGFASVTEKAHKSTVWQVRHLPQNREIFLTTGGAGSLHLWKYEYPTQRSKKDSEGLEMGVAGSVSLLQNVTVSTQPISSLDWSPDKRGLCVCSSFDQMVRVLIVTKLQTIWLRLYTWHCPEGCSQNCNLICVLHPLAPLKTVGFEWWVTAMGTKPASQPLASLGVCWPDQHAAAREGPTHQHQLCSFSPCFYSETLGPGVVVPAT